MRWKIMRGADGVYCSILMDLVESDFAALRGGGSPIETYADKAAEVIMERDVRRAGKLRDLFPDCWPKSLRGNLFAEIGEGGEWEIYKI